jgi:hypothetical protein
MNATDPRDKVYGLLGLAGLDIFPDYTNTVSEVYEKAAMEYLRIYGITYCLNEAGTSKRRRPDLPTWVPDWSCPTWWTLNPQRWQGARPEASEA